MFYCLSSDEYNSYQYHNRFTREELYVEQKKGSIQISRIVIVFMYLIINQFPGLVNHIICYIYITMIMSIKYKK